MSGTYSYSWISIFILKVNGYGICILLLYSPSSKTTLNLRLHPIIRCYTGKIIRYNYIYPLHLCSGMLGDQNPTSCPPVSAAAPLVACPPCSSCLSAACLCKTCPPFYIIFAVVLALGWSGRSSSSSSEPFLELEL